EPPPEVGLGVPERDHLPVEEGDDLRAAEHLVPGPGVAPAELDVLAVVRPLGEEPLERGMRDRVLRAARRPVEEVLEIAAPLLRTERAVPALVEVRETRRPPIDASDTGHRLERVLVPGPSDRGRHVDDEAL